MDEKEAVSTLKSIIAFYKKKAILRYKYKIVVDSLIFALRCVEKQIAKKPAGLKKNICPNCSWGIIIRTQKYCDECGQKLER